MRENDRIEVGCSVEFSGGIAPNIDCSWSANNRWENVTSITTNSTLLVELSTLATLSLKSQYVRCTTHVMNDLERQSVSEPLYQYTWTSPVVHLVTGNYV